MKNGRLAGTGLGPKGRLPSHKYDDSGRDVTSRVGGGWMPPLVVAGLL